MKFVLVEKFSCFLESYKTQKKQKENWADTAPVEKVRFLRKRRSYR